MSYDEAYAQAAQCTADKAIGCDVYWDEVNRRDAMLERRAKLREKAGECAVNAKCYTPEQWNRRIR